MSNNQYPVNYQSESGVYVELQTLTYVDPVPFPSPQCTEPTPDEQYRRTIAERNEAYSQRLAQQNAQSNAASQGSVSSFLTNLKTAATTVAMKVEKGANEVSNQAQDKARQLEQQHNADNFRAAFSSLARDGEVLLACYECMAMHNASKVKGKLYITRHYLAFHANYSNLIVEAASDVMRNISATTSSSTAPTASREIGVKQVIPLTQVASLVLSIALPTVRNGPPYFLPLPASQVIANALQIYSPQGNKLFQFFEFDNLRSKANEMFSGETNGTVLDRAYNYIDHAWRETITVPVEGVKYA